MVIHVALFGPATRDVVVAIAVRHHSASVGMHRLVVLELKRQGTES